MHKRPQRVVTVPSSPQSTRTIPPHRYPIYIAHCLSCLYTPLSITMRITTNLSFILLALAAGAVALPAPDPVKPEARALVTGLSSHTFFFVFLCPPPLLVVTHFYSIQLLQMYCRFQKERTPCVISPPHPFSSAFCLFIYYFTVPPVEYNRGSVRVRACTCI